MHYVIHEIKDVEITKPENILKSYSNKRQGS